MYTYYNMYVSYYSEGTCTCTMCKYMPNIRGYHSLTYNVWSLKGPARWRERYYHTAQLQTIF